MFCSTCGIVLQPQKTLYGTWMACPQGHVQPQIVQQTETFTQKNLHPAPRLQVATEENILAVYDHLCKKCGYEKAELLEIGASYSDEDNIYRMKCGKCGWVERLEGKVK